MSKITLEIEYISDLEEIFDMAVEWCHDNQNILMDDYDTWIEMCDNLLSQTREKIKRDRQSLFKSSKQDHLPKSPKKESVML